MRDDTEIKTWTLADELPVGIYLAASHFPPTEAYGIVTWLGRAAISAAANMVWGSNRASKKEHLKFLLIAKGSLARENIFCPFQNARAN